MQLSKRQLWHDLAVSCEIVENKEYDLAEQDRFCHCFVIHQLLYCIQQRRYEYVRT